MGTGPESAVAEAKRSLAGNVVLELRRGSDREEVRRKIGTILEGDRAKITRGSRSVAEVKIDDLQTTKEEIVEAIENAVGKMGKAQVLWIRDYGK